MSEEVRTNKRRRSESEGAEDDDGDGVGADVVGAGVPGAEVLDNGAAPRGPENTHGEEPDDGTDQADADAAAAAVEQPKMTALPPTNYTVQMTHHQSRVEEKQPVETYYKTEQQTVDTGDYKVASVGMGGLGTGGMTSGGMGTGSIGAGGMGGGGVGSVGISASGMATGIGGMNAGGMGGMGTGGISGGGMGGGGMGVSGMGGGISAATLGAGGMGTATMGAGGMAANLSALTGMGGLAALGGMGMGISQADLNQHLLNQQRQYDYAAVLKAQMANSAAIQAAAARAQPKPVMPPGRKSAPSSYEPPVQLTASGRPARARRVNYAELAGAMEDEEEDDQSNLVPNWARRRRKNNDQDRDYGVGIGSRGGGGGAQMGGNAGMYGVAGVGGYNSAPRAAAPPGGVNLYGLTSQGATGLRNAVGGTGGAGMQAANLAIAGANAALAGQVNWQGQVWGQNANMGGYSAAALQSLQAAQQQARPQVTQQFLLQQGAGRGVNPMDAMNLMLGRGSDGQGGMPGAGQQR